MKPNLFQFATSELTQDALLCWLLSWADAKHRAYDITLHKLAATLLSSIYERAGMKLPKSFDNIEIRKQDGGIDILCIINDDEAIIIEDKVGTKQHSDQLSRYKDHVSKLGYPADKVIAVYIQTGDQSDYSEVKKERYAIFERQDLLYILESTLGKAACQKSDILSDFTAYLRHIEDEVQSFKTLPLKDWSWNSWKGFYITLQKELGDGNWDYVANPAGGFLGYWWHFIRDNECLKYLQIEQEKFCFKIWVGDSKKRRILRDYWHNQIIKECPRHGIVVKRPDRFGSGEYMTVVVLDQEFRIIDEGGQLDMQQTINVIRSAESVLDALNA
jgi:hypothetical protein